VIHPERQGLKTAGTFTLTNMIGEIIAIGDELTSGRVLNTTSRFAAGQLFTAGHEIFAMATIPDTPAEIGAALNRAIKRSDFVIVTGGLGATSDDLTNEAVGKVLGRPVEFRQDVLDKIKARLPKITCQDTKHLEKLAWLPAGAEILNPDARMAGYILIHNDKPVFLLPGVPHEMKELLAERVIPRLALWEKGQTRYVRQKVYKVFGLSETEINSRLDKLEGDDEHIRIGYYPVFPEVHISLSVIEENEAETESLFLRHDDEILKLLGDSLFGTDEETMESLVGKTLVEQGKTAATAESCTGGLISHKITCVPGSSEYFAGGVVAYSNDMKERFLDVDPILLAEHGAVSSQVARAMAAGIRARTGADFGVSVTGIAGPTGGTEEKPVGTVFIGISTQHETIDTRCFFPGSRWKIQEMTAVAALDYLRRLLLNKPLK
jgi:nicotinamide-nucleotide amidase